MHAKSKQLSVLETLGFTIPFHHVIKGKECSDQYLTKILNAFKAKTNFEIDGIVVDVDNATLRSQINPTRDTLNPEYARKFKIADTNNYAETEIIEIEWRISKNGYLKPRLKLKPVDLVGVTIQHATAFNAKFVYDNKLGPGAVVGIVRAGDVIPFVQRVVKPMPL